MKTVKRELPIEAISNEMAVEILRHLADLNIYSIVRPEKVDQRQIKSCTTLIIEGLMSLVNERPELAHRIFEKMPASFQASLCLIGGKPRTDMQIVPMLSGLCVVTGCGEPSLSVRDDLLDELNEKEEEMDRDSHTEDMMPSFDR